MTNRFLSIHIVLLPFIYEYFELGSSYQPVLYSSLLLWLLLFVESMREHTNFPLNILFYAIILLFVQFVRSNIGKNIDAEQVLYVTIWFPVLLLVATRNETEKKQLIYALLLSCFVQSGYSLLQWGHLLQPNNVLFPGSGSFFNPGPLAGYLSVGIVLSAEMFQNIRERNILWGFLVIWSIILTALIISQSRAAWFACLIGIGYMLANKLDQFKRMSPYVVTLLPILLGILYYVRPLSANGRLLIWKICCLNMKDHWLFGYGADGFRQNYMMWQGEYFAQKTRSVKELLLASDNGYVFNTFLHFVVNYGLVGTLFVLLLLYAILNTYYKSRIVGSILTLCIFSCFSYPESVLPLYLLFPFLFGLCMSPSKNKSKIHIFLPWLSSVSIILTTLLIYVNITSYHRLNQYYVSVSPRRANKVDSSSVLIFNNTRWNYTVADTNFKMGLYGKAVDYYWKSIQQNPLGKTFIKMGDCYCEESDWANALLCFKQAESMLPAYATPVCRQFEIYRELGDYVHAKFYAEKILTMPIKIESKQVKQMKAAASEFLQ